MFHNSSPAFHCCICHVLVTPGIDHPACRHTCGHPECQKAYARQKSQETEYKRRRQTIELRKQNGIQLIHCAVCGDEFEIIHPHHLRKHGLTLSEYKNLYPHAPLMNQRMRETRGQGAITKSSYLSYQGKKPDRRLSEFLTGSLLGDGYLEKSQAKINARYAEGGNNQEYLTWKFNFLKQYFKCTFNERRSRLDPRTHKQYLGWWLKTSVHPVLTELHDQWYRPGKIIPQDWIFQHLTPFSLTIWMCDDGCSSQTITLYTNGFSTQEVEFLKTLLKSRFDLDFGIIYNHQQQPILRLRAASRAKFKALIAGYNIPGMAYKLNF